MQGRVKVLVSDPQAIEQALGELRWASLAGAGPGLPPIRAAVANLVAFAGREETTETMSHWVAALAAQHPCRAIILSVEPDRGAEDLDIWVSAQCHAAAVGGLICFEEVQITARGPAVERLPGLALSLLLRELPVILWWPGELPIGTPLFDRLLANSDRLVADSASVPDSEEVLRRLAALNQIEHGHWAISDLNWDRLTPWRELTAQSFDPEDCRPCLDRLDDIRIETVTSAGQRDRAQAYLFAAWLATRLGWKPALPVWSEAPKGEIVNLFRGQEPVRIAFIQQPGGTGVDVGLQNLALHASLPEGQAIFSIRRSSDGLEAEITVHLPGREPRQRTVPFPILTPTDLLGQELTRTGHDRIYLEALRLAAFLSAQRVATQSAP